MYFIIIELPEDTDDEYMTELNNTQSTLFSFPSSEKPNIQIDIVKGKPHLVRFSNSDSEQNLRDLPSNRSQTLCVLAVPHWISDFYSYLLSYSSDLVSECLESLQQVRTFLSSNYFSTVLLHFSNQSAADNFYTLFSGRDFSEPSNEYCYIGFIAETSYVKHLALKRDWKELPLCPICLERLDVNISGVAGVLRTESNSLVEKRWVEAIELCKVCKSLKLDEKDLPCEGCQEASDLWICLICGHKGCGRYQAAHGKKHFDETGHGFAIGLGSQRIWDYLNDNYVHRLLHSARGTMVLDSQFSQAAKENVERMINEYNHLIGLQLDQQRVFYEQKISTILTNKSETLHQEFKLAKSENDYLKRQISKIKACKRKKIIRESQLFDLLNENLELEALNKNLLEYVERPKELWTFEDKKSQTTYLKLERLKNELQSIMSAFT